LLTLRTIRNEYTLWEKFIAFFTIKKVVCIVTTMLYNFAYIEKHKK
jgi:hypothetical protein